MNHPSQISGLDSIRTTLIKRAFLDVSYLSEEEIDALLEKHYGADWKEKYGVKD